MRNVTISMDEELHRRLRIEAAKDGKSMSRYLADLVEKAIRKEARNRTAKNPQLEALDRILAGPLWDVSENGRMPNAEERNARR